MRKGLDDFEDLENVSEMVAETSESSKDPQSESATSDNNTCTTHVHVLPVQPTRARAHSEFAIRDRCRQGDFQREKCRAML